MEDSKSGRRSVHHKPLFDLVSRVKYDTGDGTVDAFVLEHPGGDPHMAVLASFDGGTLQLVNNGNPVPERAEGGGVTWTHR